MAVASGSNALYNALEYVPAGQNNIGTFEPTDFNNETPIETVARRNEGLMLFSAVYVGMIRVYDLMIREIRDHQKYVKNEDAWWR